MGSEPTTGERVGGGESCSTSLDNDQLYFQNQVRVFETSHPQGISEMSSNDSSPEFFIKL